MRILEIHSEPIAEIPFLNAGKGAGNFYEDRIPVLEAVVDELPEGTCGVIATGDLQGRECFHRDRREPLRLIGEVLPDILETEVLPNNDLPATGEMGALLAGDFYTVPGLDKRGGSGNVTPVWEAFAEQFAWVVGVAGNHDMFGEDRAAKPEIAGDVYYLDGGYVELGGLRIAGLSGIIGNPSRLQRRTQEDYLEELERVLSVPTDILLMHDGPDAPETGLRGSSLVREVIEVLEPTLVVRGHAHWQEPLAELDGGVQVLNVDCRAVVMCEG